MQTQIYMHIYPHTSNSHLPKFIVRLYFPLFTVLVFILLSNCLPLIGLHAHWDKYILMHVPEPHCITRYPTPTTHITFTTLPRIVWCCDLPSLVHLCLVVFAAIATKHLSAQWNLCKGVCVGIKWHNCVFGFRIYKSVYGKNNISVNLTISQSKFCIYLANYCLFWGVISQHYYS